MADEFQALRRSILESPDDHGPYLVLADHLLQIGDPRGELIVLEHRAVEQPEEIAAAREFFRANRDALLGPLDEAEPYLTGLRWSFGFVREATLQLPQDVPAHVARRIVRTALDAPAMALVHRLSVMFGSDGDAYEQNPELERTVLNALVGHGRPSVRRLHLAGLSSAVSMKRLCEALPNVETLDLACQRISFSGVKSWGVRAMTLFTSTMPVASFARADWRSLESLALIASIDGSLTELLAAAPSLRAFAISTAPRNVEVIGSLLESGLSRRIQRLRIDPTSPREIRALAREIRRFASLERVEVARGLEDLEGVLPPHVEICKPVQASDEESEGIDYSD